MEQLNRLETLLLNIRDQLTAIARQLNNNSISNDDNPSDQQQLLRQLADRRRAALERYRVEWELRGQPEPGIGPRRDSRDGEDEID